MPVTAAPCSMCSMVCIVGSSRHRVRRASLRGLPALARIVVSEVSPGFLLFALTICRLYTCFHVLPCTMPRIQATLTPYSLPASL